MKAPNSGKSPSGTGKHFTLLLAATKILIDLISQFYVFFKLSFSLAIKPTILNGMNATWYQMLVHPIYLLLFSIYKEIKQSSEFI